MSLRLSFNEKKVDRSKSDTVHMFYKHKHYASAYVHKVFPSVHSCFSLQISMKSQSMDEIKLNAFAEINNKEDYLPCYFLLNLVLEIT